MSVLMPLPQPDKIDNFCFNLVLPFLSIICMLFSQAISLHILLYAIFPQFSFVNLSHFSSQLFQVPSHHAFASWCIDRWYDHTTTESFELSYLWSSQQHLPYLKDYQSTHYQPFSQSCLIHNSKFPCFTMVQQNWSTTTLINLPTIHSKINPASHNTQFKGMLWQNIEHFLKKCIWEKLGISEMKWLKKYLFLFPTICIFDFCKNISPRLHISFLVDKSITYIMNIYFENFRNLLSNVWSFLKFN